MYTSRIIQYNIYCKLFFLWAFFLNLIMETCDMATITQEGCVKSSGDCVQYGRGEIVQWSNSILWFTIIDPSKGSTSIYPELYKQSNLLIQVIQNVTSMQWPFSTWLKSSEKKMKRINSDFIKHCLLWNITSIYYFTLFLHSFFIPLVYNVFLTHSFHFLGHQGIPESSCISLTRPYRKHDLRLKSNLLV